jgi:hypothetical protein
VLQFGGTVRQLNHKELDVIANFANSYFALRRDYFASFAALFCRASACLSGRRVALAASADGEHLHQHQAGDEAADVRCVGNAALLRPTA